MFEGFSKMFRGKPTESHPKNKENGGKLEGENTTPKSPQEMSVANRKREMLSKPDRPKNITHEKVVYRDRGDGNYESDSGNILPYVILAAALFEDHPEAGVHAEDSPSIQGGGGEFGGAGASEGWDAPSESSSDDSSSDSGSSGSSDSGSSSSE